MRKNLFVAAVFALLFACSPIKADLVITGILDGTLGGATPRAFELYTTEAIADFEAEYTFQYSSNTNSYQNITTNFGAIAANSFFYVTNSTSQMTNVFGAGLTMHQNGSITPTGNDSGRIQLDSDSSIVDEAYTNTSSASVYQDSYMYRIDGTGPDASYDAANWTFGGNNLLDGLDATGIAAAVPFGSFSAVPEPASASIIGLLGLTLLRRRRV